MTGSGIVTSISAVPRLQFRIIAGGAAGDLTCIGVALKDKLYYVGGFKLADGAPDSITVLNLTSEFTISAANTINNAAGTSSAAGLLLVIWYAPPTGGENATSFNVPNLS